MIKIILKSTYDDMKNQIAQGEAGTLRENREKNKIKKEFDIFREEHQSEIGIKNNEIRRLEKRIETLINENSQKNEALEKTINEKEELLLIVDSLKKLNRSYLATREKLSKHLQKIKKESKENEKLVQKLQNSVDAKERVIVEYEKAIEDLESKNQIQSEKIQELSKKIEHETIEYENDGLPKQTKQSLKSKRKIRRR